VLIIWWRQAHFILQLVLRAAPNRNDSTLYLRNCKWADPKYKTYLPHLILDDLLVDQEICEQQHNNFAHACAPLLLLSTCCYNKLGSTKMSDEKTVDTFGNFRLLRIPYWPHSALFCTSLHLIRSATSTVPSIPELSRFGKSPTINSASRNNGPHLRITLRTPPVHSLAVPAIIIPWMKWGWIIILAVWHFDGLFKKHNLFWNCGKARGIQIYLFHFIRLTNSVSNEINHSLYCNANDVFITFVFWHPTPSNHALTWKWYLHLIVDITSYL
jgi:hypothetical protein